MSDEEDLLQEYADQFYATYKHLQKNPLIDDDKKHELLSSFVLYLFKQTSADKENVNISRYDNHSAMLVHDELAEIIRALADDKLANNKNTKSSSA